MRIPFWKMQGAGNDFILVDDRAVTFPAGDRAWLARVNARRLGVGAEGTILIQPSGKAHVRMRFFNPDGGEVEMCGNGARCVARLAHDIGAAPAAMTIETIAGILQAEVSGAQVRLAMTPPSDWRMDQTISVCGRPMVCHCVNTGVPHVVVPVEHLDECDVRGLGRAIRCHEAFAPAGTNANFIQATGAQTMRVRTYERGVEDETLACGTGITASALVAARLGRVRPPVRVTAAGGDLLTVEFSLTASGAENVTLTGGAVHVFQGTLDYPS